MRKKEGQTKGLKKVIEESREQSSERQDERVGGPGCGKKETNGRKGVNPLDQGEVRQDAFWVVDREG